jgi:hypothetical protein
LNGEANTVKNKQSSMINAVEVRRFGHVINKDGGMELSVHTGLRPSIRPDIIFGKDSHVFHDMHRLIGDTPACRATTNEELEARSEASARWAGLIPFDLGIILATYT